MLPQNGIVLFLGGISFIFWYRIFILLKVLPSFTVISCTQPFVLQNSISSCSISCYHFRTYGPAHILKKKVKYQFLVKYPASCIIEVCFGNFSSHAYLNPVHSSSLNIIILGLFNGCISFIACRHEIQYRRYESMHLHLIL